MKVNLETVTPEAVADLQTEYLQTLTGPQDAYWQEGLIPAAEHLKIRLDDVVAGYLVQNSENELMQFFLKPNYQRDAVDIFRQMQESRSINTALASTIEPFYFSLCLDIQQRARVHTCLFSDHSKVEPVLTSLTGHQFRLATEDDLSQVLALFTGGDEFVDLDTIDAHFEGPLGYAKMVIEAGILHVLERNGEILGTGEFRVRNTWPPYVDVGMIINQKYRRQGIGTYVLGLLKQKAYEQGLKPICSCEAGNIGSRKAVENAGFITQHRVVEFSV